VRNAGTAGRAPSPEARSPGARASATVLAPRPLRPRLGQRQTQLGRIAVRHADVVALAPIGTSAGTGTGAGPSPGLRPEQSDGASARSRGGPRSRRAVARGTHGGTRGSALGVHSRSVLEKWANVNQESHELVPSDLARSTCPQHGARTVLTTKCPARSHGGSSREWVTGDMGDGGDEPRGNRAALVDACRARHTVMTYWQPDASSGRDEDASRSGTCNAGSCRPAERTACRRIRPCRRTSGSSGSDRVS
jgi:hypothetical protein